MYGSQIWTIALESIINGEMEDISKDSKSKKNLGPIKREFGTEVQGSIERSKSRT